MDNYNYDDFGELLKYGPRLKLALEPPADRKPKRGRLKFRSEDEKRKKRKPDKDNPP